LNYFGFRLSHPKEFDFASSFRFRLSHPKAFDFSSVFGFRVSHPEEFKCFKLNIARLNTFLSIFYTQIVSINYFR